MNKVARGALTTVGAQLLRRLLDLGTMVLLARLLAPADFGLVALASTVSLIAMAVCDVTLSDAIVRLDKIDDTLFGSALTIAFMRGVLVVVAIVALSIPLATLYHDERLMPLLWALSLAPFFRSIVSPKMCLFAREMSFKQESLLELGSRVTGLVAAILIAFMGGKHWAIVAGQVTPAGMYALGSYWLAPIRFRPNLQHFRTIMSFNGWILLQRLTNFINFYVDRLFIAPRLGLGQLGFYTVGGDWAALPTQALQAPLSRVLYIALMRASDSAEKFRSAYLGSVEACATLLLPIGIGMSMVAGELIEVTLGPKWLPAAEVIVILAPVFAFQALAAPAQAAVMSSGKTFNLFTRDLSNLAFRVPLLLFCLYYFGFTGLLVARAIAGVNITIVNLRLVRKIAHCTVLQQLEAAAWPVVSLIVMVIAITALKWIPGFSSEPALFRLSGEVAIGASSYAAAFLATWFMRGKPQSVVMKSVVGLLAKQKRT